ncbi:ESX-1 secretion-associated protein [Mycobacterium sp. SMC-4]|uniref:ESX-1 secretion-associated protein n=1 Tax=Mycobacterium sp. SMC-4 TaxID=2857059 RepID=UPI0021B29DC5|nr:ESX-1 secretion-associated protein [Mycobacterium sp. SMC-4]UXA18241.1 ESX-1 secretion-associated protein [Mycobacterium sp. SMC-4]
MAGKLRVNTDELRTVGDTFTAAGDRLASSDVDRLLGDAAVGVTALQTAAACRSAQNTMAAELSALARAARSYGDKLRDAATQYEQTDHRSGEQIRRVDIPPPVPS